MLAIKIPGSGTFVTAVVLIVGMMSQSANSQEFKYDSKAANRTAVTEAYCRHVLIEFFKCTDSAIFVGLRSANIRDRSKLSVFATNYCRFHINLLLQYQCPPKESREEQARRIASYVDSKIDDAVRGGSPGSSRK